MSRADHVLCEELEPRVMYSADTPLVIVSDELAGPATFALDGHYVHEAEAPRAVASVRELAFVDAALPGLNVLLHDLRHQSGGQRQIDIVLLDTDRDGLGQISDALHRYTGVDAIHVLTHGRAGAIQLGGTSLDLATVNSNSAVISGWGEALNPGADIFFYGCETAASATGSALIDALARLTGADVAASTDATGQDGDWILEYRVGTLDASLTVGARDAVLWQGQLGNQFQVNSSIANVQATSVSTRGSNQSIAVDADGDFVVVWTSDNQDGADDGVYARRFNAAGIALTAEIQVNQSTNDDQHWARVATDAAGNFVVTWTSADTDGSADNVYIRHFSAGGTALGAETRINTDTTGAQRESAIAMDAVTGDFVVTWEGKGPTDLDGIQFRRFAADGTALDPAERAGNISDTGSERDPVITLTSGGAFAIAWESSNQIYLQRFLASGVADGTEVLVSAGASNGREASLTADATGAYTVVFSSSGGTAGVYGRGYNADGTDRFALTQIAGGDATDIAIDMAADGRFIVVYEQSGDGDGTGVFARSYQSNGVAAAAAIQINQYSTGTQADAAIALIDADTYAVAWSGQSSVDSSGVLARSFLSTNAAPVTAADAYSVLQGQSVTVPAGTGVLANDADADGDTLSVLTATSAANGTLSLALDGGFAYTPTPAFSGLDTFSYLARDSGDGRTHYWGLGGSATDSVGSSHGTISGTTTVAGQFGAALEFDGVDDHVTLTDLSYSNEFALSMWFKLPSNAGFAYHTLYSHGDKDSANSVNVYFVEDLVISAYANDVLRTRIADGDDAVVVDALDIDVDTHSLDDGNWHLYTLTTQTGVGARVYIDGVLAASHANGGNALNPSGNAVIGAEQGLTAFRYHQGSIDGVQMHDHTLEFSEITSILNATPATVALTVTTNTAPVISSNGGGASASITLTENTTAVTTVIASDGESPPQTLTYSTSGTDAARFTIGASSGVLAFASAPDREAPNDTGADGTYEVTVSVSDGLTSTSQLLTITISDLDEHDVSSIADGNAATNSVSENAAHGTLVGITALASDADATNSTVTYSLDVDAGGRFAIDSASGVVRVADASLLDYEVVTSHSITVRAVSTDGSSSTASMVVSLIPQNDRSPVFSSTATPSVAENSTAVITLSSSDTDLPAQTVSYTITGGADMALFSLTGTALRFVSAPDYETPTGPGTDNTYEVQVTASDGAGGTVAQLLTVSVTNVNEAPVVTVPGAQSTDASTPVVFATGMGTVISLADVDAGSAAILVDLSISHGTLTLASVSGLSLSAGTGSGDMHMIFTGAVSDINAALDGLQYVPDSSFSGTATLAISVSDQGHAGAGGALSAAGAVAISMQGAVAPVTNPPIPIVPPSDSDSQESTSKTTTEDTSKPPGESSSSAASGASAGGAVASLRGTGDVPSFETEQNASAGFNVAAATASSPRVTNHTALSSNGAVWVRPQSVPGSQGLAFQLTNATGAGAGVRLTVEELRGSLSASQFLAQLQFVREQMEQEIRLDGAMIGATAFVSGGLSVGYVLWLLRGGLLMSTLLTSLPAWHTIDPLPVLGRKAGDDDLTDSSDAVEHMFQNARDARKAKVPAAPSLHKGVRTPHTNAHTPEVARAAVDKVPA